MKTSRTVDQFLRASGAALVSGVAAAKLSGEVTEVEDSGRVGFAGSLADVLAVVYKDVARIRPEDPEWEGRDRILLSMGHYAIALYAALAEAGVLSVRELETYGSETGLLRESWPIRTPGSVGHLQAYGRIALVSVDPRYRARDLRVVDLKTGKSVTLPKRARSGWNDASVGPLGIVHPVNNYKAYGGSHPSGSLVFLSTSRVLSGIARGHLK